MPSSFLLFPVFGAIVSDYCCKLRTYLHLMPGVKPNVADRKSVV